MSDYKKKSQTSERILDLNIIDLILIDHRFIKECIDILTDHKADKRRKLSISKQFLESVSLHQQAEKSAVYLQLEKNQELHFNILEAQIEHGIIEQKVKKLKTRIANARSLKIELEAELSVLAGLLRKHINEEENEILPRMNEFIEDETLREMGRSFMEQRNFSVKDFKDYPLVQEELVQWKDSVQKVSSEFLSRMDKCEENLHH